MYIYWLDLIGTFVFAISGILTASGKGFDFFGVSVIAMVTAIGGGTLRDVLIGSTPVGWMEDLNYLFVILTGILFAFLFKKYIQRLRRTLFLFDTIGIGVFTILGLEKTLSLGLSPVIAVMMGTVSAVFGGVVRDLLSNVVPLIFRKEIYATVCLLGGEIYLLLDHLETPRNLNISLTIGLIIVVRLLAVLRNWHFRPVE
jgi:uncharacterized membrane protein YeiH